MADQTYLDWPFFEDRHRSLAAELDAWAEGHLDAIDHSDTDAACRQLVTMLGDAGFAAHSGSEDGKLDVRTLCLIRETLARHDGLADFAFAMQGLVPGRSRSLDRRSKRPNGCPSRDQGRRFPPLP